MYVLISLQRENKNKKKAGEGLILKLTRPKARRIPITIKQPKRSHEAVWEPHLDTKCLKDFSSPPPLLFMCKENELLGA